MAEVEIIELRKTETGEKFYPLTHVNAVVGLDDRTFFELDSAGNVTLKPQYQNLWVPGWFAALGKGSASGGGSGTDLSSVWTSLTTNTDDYKNRKIHAGHLDLSAYYTQAQVNNLLSGKQATLVSGTNIKTINGESLKGEGDIEIEQVQSDWNQSDSSKQYVATIISIGHILNLKVVSEGVETEDQLSTLKDIGCDYIQGYIWGEPMPPEEAEKIILNYA